MNFTDYDILWFIEDSLSGDLVAGLLVGLNMLIDDITVNYNKHSDNIITIESKNVEIRHDLHMVGIENILDKYIALLYINHYEIDNKTIDLPPDESFMWWILDIPPNTVTLYKFRTPEFIQGFISMCNAFNVNFRDYIFGLPFKVNDKGEEMYYNIQGYDIEPMP